LIYNVITLVLKFHWVLKFIAFRYKGWIHTGEISENRLAQNKRHNKVAYGPQVSALSALGFKSQ